jgi:predicted DsbA family dithiol-disulfide isomerase
MAKEMRIDFVSDVVCPWCAIGLAELKTALARLADVIEPTIELQPFELNPGLPPEGQDLVEHLTQKFGPGAMERMKGAREALTKRAADVGFKMAMRDGGRIHSSFDAHRLLHWAGLQDKDKAVRLKQALFGAYFTETQNISDPDILAATAESVGLDGAQARDVLATGRYGAEVKAAEQQWIQSGINSVPSVVINQKYLISGGQTAAVFEESLRQIAAEAAE